MHTCFWDIIYIINICPNNFSVQLEQSVACGVEGGEIRLTRDSVHLNIDRGRESCVREDKQQKIESWFVANYSGKQAGIFESGLYIMFIFSFKKLPNYFYSVTYFSMNHLKIDLIFWWTPGEILNLVWLSTFTPVELDMRLGTCHSDKMEPILTVLEGKGWEIGCGCLRIRHSILCILTSHFYKKG